MYKFDDIIGYENEKKELKMLCDVLKNTAKYKRMNIQVPNALLIYGEPGLGKTLMAKALIDQSGRNAFYCRKDRADGEFVNAIKETFEKAEKEAPSIVFLDDMDKFAQDNLNSDCNKEEFAVIQSCLENVRGKDVFVLATANEKSNLPESLLRAGRFGRQMEVRFPDMDDAERIIKHYLKNKNMAGDVSYKSIAYILCGYSCAELETAVNEAGLIASFSGSQTIKKEHFLEAIIRTVLKVDSSLDKNKERLKRTAYHEAGHAVVALACGDKVGYITIRKHGDTAGCCKITREDSFGYNEMINDVKCHLAGRAAVELEFNELDVGAKSDLMAATNNVRTLIEKHGTCGLDYLYDFGSYYSRQDDEQTANITYKTIEFIKEKYQEVKNILCEKRELLNLIAQALLQKEILIYDDVEEILKSVS